MDAGRIALAEVVQSRDARPRVRLYEQFSREGTEIDMLKRVAKSSSLARRRCVTCLSHGQYQLLQVDVPDNLPKEAPVTEVRDTLRWRIKEMVDFPVDQAGIDVMPMTVQGNRTPQIWVVAASHAQLRPPIELFQDAKVPLEAIDIPEFAQRNLARLFEDEERGLALVSFDEQGGRLTITYQGELYFSRHLDATSTELANPNAVTQHERVLLDIQRSLDNFDRNYSAIPMSRLLIAPLPGGDVFVEYLRSNLSLIVASANLADVLDLEATPQLSDVAAQNAAWVALGAALRE